MVHSKSDDLEIERGETVILKNQDDQMEIAAATESNSRQVIDGRFEVIEKLGSGGMSTVYKVRHLHLQKVFALKLLHKVSKESLQRFQQEAKASSLLDHPNIVAVRDFGITDQQPYMLMDCLEGESLAGLIEKSKGLEPGRAIALFEQIASALAHAHSQGVVHRDIKPSNIMVISRSDGTEQAILVDFGIAKLMPLEEQENIQHLTRTGDVFGTPLYMSPEQCLGFEIDARTDIYSLSCVFYEALCGHPPFEGASVYETIHKQINDAPPPFPERVRKTSAGRRLEALILKGMAKLPQNRHKFMLEFATELKCCEIAAGPIEEVKSLFAVLFGRHKAAESKVLFQNLALQLATFLALIISANLLVLPHFIASAGQAERQNHAIVKKVNRILEMRFSLRQMLKGDDEGLDRNMRALAKLCQSNPDDFKAYRRFQAEVDAAVADGTLMTGQFRDTMFGGGFTAASFSSFAERFDTVSTRWSNTAKEGARMAASSHERYLSNLQRKYTLRSVYLGSALLSPFVAIFVLLGLMNRFSRYKKSKES